MAIAPGTIGSTSMTSSATSTTVDITAATVGDWVYCWVALGINSGTVSATGWTSLLNADEGTSAHYALLRRQKQVGDTTFSFGWTTTTKGTLGWASWSGLDSVTPDEGATLVTNGVSSRTAVPTPSGTPTAATRWAVGFYGVRTTTAGNKPITWTPDAALTERLDVDNSAAASAPWMGLEIADSNAAVTQAAHSYTATHNAAETHDGSAILFLIPAATAASATPQPIVTAVPGTWAPPPQQAILSRSSLQDPPTPGPIVSFPKFDRPASPQSATILRGSLNNPPVLTTPTPVVVGLPYSRVLPPATLQVRASLADAAAPPATAAPAPVIVTGNPPLQLLNQVVLRASLANPPVLTTSGPLVVALAAPQALPPRTLLTRSSLADPTATKPLVAITPWAPRVPASVLTRSSLADPVAPPGTPAPIVVFPPVVPWSGRSLILASYVAPPALPELFDQLDAGPVTTGWSATMAEPGWAAELATSWRSILTDTGWEVR